MINTIKENFKRALYALIFSVITIASLSFLSFETSLWIIFSWIIWIFYGSSLWISRKPFRSTKKCFLWTLGNICSWCNHFEVSSIDLYLQIAIAVGLGIFAMILLGVTHPPAGGNPIVIILGAASYNFLIKSNYFWFNDNNCLCNYSKSFHFKEKLSK